METIVKIFSGFGHLVIQAFGLFMNLVLQVLAFLSGIVHLIITAIHI